MTDEAREERLLRACRTLSTTWQLTEEMGSEVLGDMLDNIGGSERSDLLDAMTNARLNALSESSLRDMAYSYINDRLENDESYYVAEEITEYNCQPVVYSMVRRIIRHHEMNDPTTTTNPDDVGDEV